MLMAAEICGTAQSSVGEIFSLTQGNPFGLLSPILQGLDSTVRRRAITPPDRTPSTGQGKAVLWCSLESIGFIQTLPDYWMMGTSKNQATSAAGWPVAMKTPAAARDYGCQQDCPAEKEAIFRGALMLMSIPRIPYPAVMTRNWKRAAI